MKQNALQLVIGIVAGLIAVIVPPLWGIVLSAVVSISLLWRAVSKRMPPKRAIVAPLTIWTVVLGAYLAPIKFDDKLVEPPEIASTNLKMIGLVYADVGLRFPEESWDTVVSLPQQPMTVRELRRHFEKELGMNSVAKACDWGCNILSGCAVGPIYFTKSLQAN